MADVEKIDVVFAGDHQTGLTFVEVEQPDGTGVRAGTWYKREDGYWCLQLTVAKGDIHGRS